jgi:hypothetical protein
MLIFGLGLMGGFHSKCNEKYRIFLFEKSTIPPDFFHNQEKFFAKAMAKYFDWRAEFRNK